MTNVDPWFADNMAEELSKIAEDNPELAPTPEEIAAADGAPVVPEPTPEPVPEPAPVPQPSAPKVTDLGNGATITEDVMPDGTFRAVLDSGSGKGKEVFYGKTDSELKTNVFVAKLNATRKINSQKQEIDEIRKRVPVEAPAPRVRKLTADENFELKTKLTSDPDSAFELWFEKKTGKSLEVFTTESETARAEVKTIREGWEAKQFVDENEDYVVSNKNSAALTSWLTEHKKEITTENLWEAFEDLSKAGLLDMPQPPAPAPTPTVTPEPVPAPTVTAPTNERIVREERRSRAGLGIRTAETTDVPAPTTERPPSDEGLRSLPPAELEKLVQDTLRLAASSRR